VKAALVAKEGWGDAPLAAAVTGAQLARRLYESGTSAGKCARTPRAALLRWFNLCWKARGLLILACSH
jgi:hypothetical protein